MKKRAFLGGIAVLAIAALLVFSCEPGSVPGPEPEPELEPTPNFNIAGTYEFTQTGGSTVYTWVFSNANSYTVTRSVGSTVNTGTYSVSGNEITVTTAALTTPVSVPSFSEVFTITSSGRNVTLTLKGSSPVSNFLTSIGNGGALTTITMTKQLEKVVVIINKPLYAQQVAAWGDYTVAVGTDGSLWNWGYITGTNSSNVLFNNSSPIISGTETDWVVISSSRDTMNFIKTDGSLWRRYNGIGTILTPPYRIGIDTDWLNVAPGSRYRTFAIKTDGSLWAWGQNQNGELGLGDTTDRSAPTQVGTDTDWVIIAASHSHSVAIKADGSLWVWGYHYYAPNFIVGQSSSDDLRDNIPVKIETDSSWASVAAGHYYTLAIKTDGSLWAWGSATTNNGQLGLGDITGTTIPTQIGIETDWMIVFADKANMNGGTSFAIKTDGSLWAWGSNRHGQLGDGTGGGGFEDTTSDKNTPVRIGTETNWVTVSPGNGSTIAIKTDGSIWSWGYNFRGQLGLGDKVNRNTPTQVFFEEEVIEYR